MFQTYFNGIQVELSIVAMSLSIGIYIIGGHGVKFPLSYSQPLYNLFLFKGKTGHYQEVNVTSTGRFLKREVLSADPGYSIPMIQQEQQHRSSSQDAAYEVPFHSVGTPGYPQLDPVRDTKTGHTYQNILKVPGMHDQESFKMKKVEGNLSAYQELDQCRREVDNHVYQQLAKT